MVSLTILTSALMGLLVVATFIAIARVGKRREPPGEAESVDGYTIATDRLSEVVRSPAVWSIAFVVITVGVGAAAVLAVGDFGLPEGVPELLLGAVYGAVGVLVTGFVFLGAYFGARNRGLGNAHGIAAGSFAAGMVFLLLISVQLIVGVIG